MAELISQPTKINNNNFGAGAYIHIINNPPIWLHLLFDPKALIPQIPQFSVEGRNSSEDKQKWWFHVFYKLFILILL